MNNKRIYGFLFVLILLFSVSKAQVEKYSTSAGELIFSWGDLAFTNQYVNAHPNAEIVNTPLRFTCFFHLGQNYHIDLSEHLGVFTGYGLRNVGFITDEVLPTDESSTEYFNAKIVRRTYSLGIPMAIKIGSMKNRSYLYGGGEIEWAFAYKEKFWDSHDREGTKSKYTSFMGRQVNPLLPSAFMGVQFKKGMNIKLKYYLTDFLNHDYSGRYLGVNRIVSDLTKYNRSQLVYIALTWQLDTKEIKEKRTKTEVASVVDL